MIETEDFTPDQALMIAIRLEADDKVKEAEDIYRGILEIDPNHFNALNRLGALLTNKKEYFEALYRFDRAIKVNPKAAMAISNKGMILGELGHLEESELEFKKAIEVEPHNHVFWNNLGITLERLHRYEEALEATDKGLSLLGPNETSSTMLTDKGVILQRLNCYTQAISCHSKALEIDPHKPESHYNIAISKLILGDLVGGFEEYEWRFRVDAERDNVTVFSKNSKSPQWRGEGLSGKSILVHAEQGLGDTIQFIRYVSLVLEKTDKVFLVVHSSLIGIVHSTFGSKLTMVGVGEEYPPHDYIISVMSLPFVFKTSNGTVPKPWQINIDASAIEKRMPDINGRFNVGVCWSGNWKQKNDFRRSIKFSDFKSLLSTEGVSFYSLQKEVRQEDAYDVSSVKNLRDLGLGDFMDTAAVISLLDLVITVDTSIGHLAGTLGVPTWILVPNKGFNWVWQQGRKDTPWYPSVRLFRQAPRDGNDWESTLEWVAGCLKGKVLQRSLRDKNSGL